MDREMKETTGKLGVSKGDVKSVRLRSIRDRLTRPLVGVIVFVVSAVVGLFSNIAVDSCPTSTFYPFFDIANSPSPSVVGTLKWSKYKVGLVVASVAGFIIGRVSLVMTTPMCIVPMYDTFSK